MVAIDETLTTGQEHGVPGADLDPARAPGHWLLARLGRRLRPGVGSS